MATRLASVEWVGKHTVKITWTGLLPGDEGEPQDVSKFDRALLQVRGVFAPATILSVETGNEPLIFVAAETRPISITDGRLQPRVPAGMGATNLTVIALCSRGLGADN